MEAAKAQKDEFMPVIRSIKSDYVAIIDVDELTENGIAFTYDVIAPIVKKLKDNEIDALFLPFCDFGEESVAAGIASAFKVPTLVWGPRDTEPNSDVTRGRDTQCGIIAATKVLSRCGVKFSYIVNCPTQSEQFKNGFETFLRASMIVKTMRTLRVAQIGNRPEPFMSVMTNEAELLERFGINVIPVSIPTIVKYTDEILAENGEQLQKDYADYTARVDCSEMENFALGKMIGLKSGEEAVRRALQMGADSGVVVSDDYLAGADVVVTAHALAAAVGRIGAVESGAGVGDVDLVVTGMAALDAMTSMLPGALAAALHVPALTLASSFEASTEDITVTRTTGTLTEVLSAPLPALVSVTDQANEPRYPNFAAMRAAKKKPVDTWDLADLGIQPRRSGVDVV